MEKSEEKIQQQQVMFYKNAYCLKHHYPRNLIMSIPNEGKPELVRTGLYPGAADLMIIHFGQILFIENKTPTGRQSQHQKEFQNHVESLGFPYHVCRSLDDFKAVINQYTPQNMLNNIKNHSN